MWKKIKSFLETFKIIKNFIEPEESIKVMEVDKIILKEERRNNSNFVPLKFNEYIGQNKTKSILRSYIKGIESRKIAFPHTLLIGNAGMGKTTLARIIANELNKELIELIAASIEENSLQEIVKTLNSKILFIDEIHSLARNEVESIYSMMENFSLNGKQIEPFTLIGATTEGGEIIKNRKPFYDRFKLYLELENYNTNNLINIAKQYKNKTFPDDEINEEDYKIIAINSRDTPRNILKLIEALIFSRNINKVLKNFNIIYKGYTTKDLKLLNYLAKNKTTGLQGISAFLDTSQDNYLYTIEPFLLKTGLIIRSPRGRKISDEGLKLLKTLKGK